MTAMQRQQRQDILLMNGGDPMLPRRSMSQRSGFVPPLELTISVPTQTTTTTTNSNSNSKKDQWYKAPWQPPQELKVENPHEKWTPPKMIEVKESFAPPLVVVIAVDKPKAAVSATTNSTDTTTTATTATIDRIPGVIQVQETKSTPVKKTRSPSFRKEPPLGRIVRSLSNDGSTLPSRHSIIKRRESDMYKRRESELNKRRESEIRSGNERRPSRDPPAAKAPTTTNKIQRLPDFSVIAKQRRSSEGIPSTTTRINYLLGTMSSSSSNNKCNEAGSRSQNKAASSPRGNKRQSWSGPSESNNTDVGRRHRTNGTVTQVHQHHLVHHQPHWIGVTGSPEDWIHGAFQRETVEI